MAMVAIGQRVSKLLEMLPLDENRTISWGECPDRNFLRNCSTFSGYSGDVYLRKLQIRRCQSYLQAFWSLDTEVRCSDNWRDLSSRHHIQASLRKAGTYWSLSISSLIYGVLHSANANSIVLSTLCITTAGFMQGAAFVISVTCGFRLLCIFPRIYTIQYLRYYYIREWEINRSYHC